MDTSTLFSIGDTGIVLGVKCNCPWLVSEIIDFDGVTDKRDWLFNNGEGVILFGTEYSVCPSTNSIVTLVLLSVRSRVAVTDVPLSLIFDEGVMDAGSSSFCSIEIWVAFGVLRYVGCIVCPIDEFENFVVGMTGIALFDGTLSLVVEWEFALLPVYGGGPEAFLRWPKGANALGDDAFSAMEVNEDTAGRGLLEDDVVEFVPAIATDILGTRIT